MMDKSNYIGKQIGNYRIIKQVSIIGGFGSVYQGKHIVFTERPVVAIKLLHALLASDQEKERFLQEARFLEKLKHPYILPVIDAGIQDGLPYLIAEYATNGSLKDRLQRQSSKPLAIEEALLLLSQIGQALQHAHSQNIVHRDLKPDNILFNAKGHALLADFGIAVVLDGARTNSVDFTGSPPYMAPEQFEGKASMKSDIYALGCIDYELFTGHRPFTISPDADIKWLAWRYQHATKDPAPPTRLNPRLPMYIEQAILKAMAKQRTNRHTDISAFISALGIVTTSQAPLTNISSTAAPAIFPKIFQLNKDKWPSRNKDHSTPRAKPLRLDVAQLTDVGRKREHNKDNMAYVIPKDSRVMVWKGALFIIADGAWEYAAGEVASEIAVDTVTNVYYQDDSDDAVNSLLNAIRRANSSINQRASEKTSRTGMRTAFVAAVLHGNIAYVANVGNCRAYLIHRGQIEQITQDHSWVAEQVHAGLLAQDQAGMYAQRNVTTRSLGMQADVEIDIFSGQLETDNSLILCTNGLYDLVSDGELCKIVDQYIPQESVYHLVERANENGGLDNITVQVIRVLEDGS